MSSKVYVLDTNVLLQNIQNLYRLSESGQNLIVIPETVLLELEDKKKLPQEIGYQARSFARFLAASKVKEVKHKKGFKVIKLYKDDIKIDLISKDSYNADLEYKYIAESNDKSCLPHPGVYNYLTIAYHNEVELLLDRNQ